MRCAVIGAGAWGTALADLLATTAHETVLWALEPDVAESINDRAREPALPRADCRSRDRRSAPRTIAQTRFGARRSSSTRRRRTHLRRVAAECARRSSSRDAMLVVATKGIEQDTLALMTHGRRRGGLPGHAVVGISGPSFAAEVVARQPTAVVAASTHPDARALVTQAALSSATLSRLHATTT